MKMQLGSAVLHCATAGKHLPLAQKKSAGQVTFWHWLATGWDDGMLQLPSERQTLPPPPQSESRWHLDATELQFPPGQFRAWPSPHPARSAIAKSPRSPLDIPHPPPARMAGGQEVGMSEAGGNRPNGGRAFAMQQGWRASPCAPGRNAARRFVLHCRHVTIRG